MPQENEIVISGKTYSIEDVIDNIALADSFVKSNKLQETIGHGEARLYIGPQGARDYSYFFDHFRAKCLFTKEDLARYMIEAETEYKLQEQKYRKNISDDYSEYTRRIATLDEGDLFFSIENALGGDRNRYYIRSEDPIWTLMREIALPKISYLTALRLRDNSTGEIVIYFRLFIDYGFNRINHPKLIQKEIEEIESSKLKPELKAEIKISRDGQGKYREKLLSDMPACPFTGVTEERLLIASHIKPWAVSDNVEKIDPFNGLMLTPTFDRLFDQGFITFSDSKVLIVSPYLSPMNTKRLFLVAGKTIEKIPIVGREKYMYYHRENVFKK